MYKGTGNKNNIVIQNDQNRLSPEDIERMINDAEKFAEDDKKVKERSFEMFFLNFVSCSVNDWW